MSLDSMGKSTTTTSGGGGTLTGSKMIHSLSTPSGVDGTVSHTRGGKKLAVRVQMLDDSVTMFQVQVFIFFFDFYTIIVPKKVQGNIFDIYFYICL